VFIVAQALAGLVVARALSHIHLACAGGEAVLRRGTHSAVVAREGRGSREGIQGSTALLRFVGRPEQEGLRNRLQAS
jgi:hypothetical protein